MPTVVETGTGLYRAGTSERHIATEPKFAKRNGTEIGVLAVHGHGASATTFMPGTTSCFRVAYDLAEARFTVLSIDAGGGSGWADDDVMSAMDAGANYLRDHFLVDPVICLLGWSMGGLSVLNWMKRNPTRVSRCVAFAPATDISYFHGNVTYGPEIEADYGGASVWTTGIVGHSPSAEVANYRGLPPTRIYHGDADTTVPPAQTQTFVTQVNDSNLARYTVPGKDHITVFDGVSNVDVIEFFRGLHPA